jgi:hypothetical protein
MSSLLSTSIGSVVVFGALTLTESKPASAQAALHPYTLLSPPASVVRVDGLICVQSI